MTTQRVASSLLAVALLLAPTPAGAQALCGLYLLDGPDGTHRDGNIRDFDFVDGYVLRLEWQDVEPSAGVFDFAAIDHVLARADALGQRLTLHLLGTEPAHVVADAAQTWTWVDPNPRHEGRSSCTPSTGGCARPVPWDPAVLERKRQLLLAIADHLVPSPSGPVRFADHPAFTSLSATIPGLGLIREIGFEVEGLPGYSREKLIHAIVAAVGAHVEAFPRQAVFVGFWTIQDQLREPALWDEVRLALLAAFDGRSAPQVGFFQENLAQGQANGIATYAPSTTFAAPLYLSRDQAFVAFQALTAWARPFTGEEKVAGGSPAAAMAWARDTYGARYFELYTIDLDTAVQSRPDWLAELRQVQTGLCAP
jgi:hypothetical protein